MTVEEYNQCVENHADALYRFILKNIKEENRARDIVQDAFEKMWVKKETVTGSKGKSYLFSTAYHTMIDVIRKESRQTSMEHAGEGSFSDHGSYTDLNEKLHEAIEKLPEAQRAVIMLRDYEGYAYNEIAEITNLTEAQVKVYIYRGRQFLKKYIGSIEALV